MQINSVRHQPLLLAFTILGILSCTNPESKTKALSENKTLEWIREREEIIHNEFMKMLDRTKSHFSTDTNFLSRTLVVTEYDSTILGELAKRLKAKNDCYLVEYEYFKNRSQKKIIRISPGEDTCTNISLRKSSDTLKYFIVENLPE